MDLSGEARESYSAWVDARRDALLRTAYLLTGDRARADDLLQDSLIKVARRWRQVRSGNPDAYVRRVMYHGQISWWRSRRETPVAEVRGRLELDPPTDDRLVIRQALMRLPARQRAVIVLRYLEDVTEREAASVLGVSVGTIKSQTSAALRTLRGHAPELAELIGRGDGG